MKKERVLFVCTGNSARSQMAEAILRDLAGDRFEVFSAGAAPTVVHPMTIEVMNEIGIDVTSQRSKHVDEFKEKQLDFVITVCDRARDNCPSIADRNPLAWGFDDPAAAPSDRQKDTFRRVRNEIMHRIRLFLLANRG